MSAEQQEQIAADWVARQDRGLTGPEHAQMQAWLAQSPAHKVAYLRLKAAWARADRLAALHAPMRAPVPQASSWRGWALAAAAVALLAVMGSAGLVYLQRQEPATQTFATRLGETQQVELADGSRMQLNTNTRLHADMRENSRTVTLDSGEAFFDIVHDARRPFTVFAGNRRITDLGTRFSVYRKGEDVRVTVQEGRVRVDVLDGGSAAAPVELAGGHAVIAHGSETLLVDRSAQDITNDLSWRNGMLVFNQQSLAEAAEQFNRYNSQQILVEGKARKIRIGGSFKADNVAGFAALLHQGFGLTVSQRGNDIVVSR